VQSSAKTNRDKACHLRFTKKPQCSEVGYAAANHFAAPVLPTKEKDMPSGTVKWFNTTKGYGFIAPDGGGTDIFVHISAVEQSGLTGLADNEKVTFDLIEGRDGRKMAGNIAKAS
jgi:CspA family cold shock protein